MCACLCVYEAAICPVSSPVLFCAQVEEVLRESEIFSSLESRYADAIEMKERLDGLDEEEDEEEEEDEDEEEDEKGHADAIKMKKRHVGLDAEEKGAVIGAATAAGAAVGALAANRYASKYKQENDSRLARASFCWNMLVTGRMRA